MTDLWAKDLCPKPWSCQMLDSGENQIAWQPLPTQKNVLIRAGFLKEQGLQFKGNIIYFQGLGDSMLNHLPLFNKLTSKGYRVIAFDYMGQGKSEGYMNDTRISDIGKLGELAWKKFARGNKSYNEKTVIGWSTGGLAAYYEAHHLRAKKVVLIAPGIAPNTFVGENDLCEGKIDLITLASLTSETYFNRSSNPHIDAIKPNSPLKVPLFSVNLLTMAKESRQWKINKSVQGLILLSGKDDTYVNAAKTETVIGQNAPHFRMETFDGALHEIDNEVPSISDRAHQDILNFIDKN